MAQIHTHYDNLKVTRNAPPEVIRAAYKSLSQKFHPDRNPDNPAATHTIQVINLAYEILSDPVKRKEHDNWIAKAESADLVCRVEPSLGFANGQTPPNQYKNVRRKISFTLHKRRKRQSLLVVGKSKMTIRRMFKNFFLLVSATLVVLGILGG
jgi:curved DNA-binding protein CbpA